jgi:preprotein translocase subunit SecB
MLKVAKSGKTKVKAKPKALELRSSEESYKIFLKGVELFALGMDSIDAKLDREQYHIAHSKKTVKIDKTIENSFTLVEFSRDHFDVAANFIFTMQVESDSPFLRIAVNFEAHFHWKDGEPEKQHVERFAEGEARLIFWPYFRQAVSDITSRMYIRQVTIPLTLSV